MICVFRAKPKPTSKNKSIRTPKPVLRGSKSAIKAKTVVESKPAVNEKTASMPSPKDRTVFEKGVKRKSHDGGISRPMKRRKTVEGHIMITRSMTKAGLSGTACGRKTRKGV